MNKYQAKWGDAPLTCSINSRDNTFLYGASWFAIPLDENGLYDVEWLQWLSVPIASSKVVEEKHHSIEGKNIPYVQRYRVDTFAPGTNVFAPRICLFYSETRGDAGYLAIGS